MDPTAFSGVADFLFRLIVFVAVLGLLVMVHELGHFVMAKRAGVKVLEFGFGFPPRLFGIRHGETEYTINALPLGGFVKMLGEEDPTDKRSLAAQPARTRLIVLAAGATMNLVLAVVLFAVSFMIPREIVQGQVVIQRIAPGSPAEAAGLLPGDRIVRVNEQSIQNTGDLSFAIYRHRGEPVTMQVRAGRASAREVTVTPRLNPPAGEGATGIEIGMQGTYVDEVSYPIWEAVPLGITRMWDMLVITKNDFAGLFAKQEAPPVAGPIGIYQMTGEVAKTGLARLLEFTGLLSLNLAIINLLPIPMLDGGRIVFVLIEAVRGGRRIAPEKESLVHLAGLVMILALVVIISYNDIVRIVSGGSVVR